MLGRPLRSASSGKQNRTNNNISRNCNINEDTHINYTHKYAKCVYRFMLRALIHFIYINSLTPSSMRQTQWSLSCYTESERVSEGWQQQGYYSLNQECPQRSTWPRLSCYWEVVGRTFKRQSLAVGHRSLGHASEGDCGTLAPFFFLSGHGANGFALPHTQAMRYCLAKSNEANWS